MIFKILPNKINVNITSDIIEEMNKHFKIIPLPIVKITKSIKVYCGFNNIKLPIKSFKISDLIIRDILPMNKLNINIFLNLLDIIKKQDILDLEYFLYHRRDIIGFNNSIFSLNYKLHFLNTLIDFDYLNTIYYHINKS